MGPYFQKKQEFSSWSNSAYCAAHKNTVRISVLNFLTSSHSMFIVSVHFINLLLTRRAQDSDFKSHLRVWKPLLSSNCLPLGHCYYYTMIYIYIFCLEAALYLLSPVFLPDIEDKNSNQHGTSARAHSWPPAHYLQPFLMFHWLFSKPRGLSCEIPEKLVLSSSAKNTHFM